MYAEKLAVLLGNESISAVRTGKSEWCSNDFARGEGLTADFALILTVAPVVVVNVEMWSTAQRTDSICRDGLAIATLNRLDRLAILPLIVFKKELPVLFYESFNDREMVDFEFLILR